MTVQSIRRLLKCFKDLHFTEDILSFLIRGHLYCESALSEILMKSIKRPNAIDIERMDYKTKLNLCNALGLIQESLVPGLAKLGQLRNRTAHRIEHLISEQDQTDFINIVRSAGGEHIEYYLSKRTHFPNGLRRCVFGLLFDLSVNLADTIEEKKELLIGLTIAMQHISGMEIEKFMEKVNKELR